MTPNPPGNILVVDDTPHNLHFLSHTLTEKGYKVRSVMNGQMALTVAQAAELDLILLDIKMPDIDGYEVCQQLKANAATRAIPIIFLSALDEVLDKVKAFKVGGIDYITKPFQLEEVLARVENQLAIRFAQLEVERLNQQLEQRVIQRTAQLEQEIAERQKAQGKLLHLALHDSLTGLPNRAWLMKRLAQVLNRTKQQRDYLFSVLFLGCDRFKLVNDSLGHLVGDQLLVAVARRLESCVPSATTLARLGGDEFVILLDFVDNLDEAIKVVEQIHKEMSQPFNLQEYRVFINTSIGIVLGSQTYSQPEHLLRDADTAMYRAKASGKCRYQVFHPEMHHHALLQLQLETDLRVAITRQEFMVHYQPIVSLVTGQITELEALVRWQHSSRGMIPPEQFILVAEQTGLIVEIDFWVLEQACRQLQAWRIQELADLNLKVSVNLSAQHFSQSGLIEKLDQVLSRTQLPSHCLKIEITESAIMENTESAAIIMAQLKTRQIQVSIDDFGTGYSSLSYLHRFQVDTLKIDHSFVSCISDDGDNLEIVEAIAQLAHNLGIDVTAEGIETSGQLEQLRELRCEFGQGYFFSSSLTQEEIENMLLRQQPLYST